LFLSVIGVTAVKCFGCTELKAAAAMAGHAQKYYEILCTDLFESFCQLTDWFY
jgi:hypothetical protein